MPDFSPESVAFVTGAASGIGLAVAQRLVSDGIKNIALVDVTPDRLSTASTSLSAIDPQAKVLTLTVDCSDENAVEAAVTQTVSAFGRLDVCFNAAGISGEGKPTAEQTAENLDAVLGLNLKGVFYCERAQIKQMLKQEMRDVTTGLALKTRGSIVNVGSLTSHLAIKYVSPYIMAKHGVLGLSKADALEYGTQGIRVNCICPGWIRTNMTQGILESPRSAALIERTPMARFGMPEEVAYTVSFLSSDKASFITGTYVDIDGGYSAC